MVQTAKGGRHIAPVLKSLHWLKIPERIHFSHVPNLQLPPVLPAHLPMRAFHHSANPRVTIRPGFPGHVLFFGPCPKCPDFVRVLNTSVPDRLKIRLLFVFSHVRPGSFDRHLLTYFSVFLLAIFRTTVR